MQELLLRLARGEPDGRRYFWADGLTEAVAPYWARISAMERQLAGVISSAEIQGWVLQLREWNGNPPEIWFEIAATGRFADLPDTPRCRADSVDRAARVLEERLSVLLGAIVADEPRVDERPSDLAVRARNADEAAGRQALSRTLRAIGLSPTQAGVARPRRTRAAGRTSLEMRSHETVLNESVRRKRTRAQGPSTEKRQTVESGALDNLWFATQIKDELAELASEGVSGPEWDSYVAGLRDELLCLTAPTEEIGTVSPTVSRTAEN